MKIVPHFYDLCPEVPGYGIAALFSKRAAFSRQTALQSLDCGALQDGTLRRGHQSAALLPSGCGTFGGRKQRVLNHFSSAAAPRLLHSF